MLCALNLFELGELRQDRIHLYDRCINILLRRDENRDVDFQRLWRELQPGVIPDAGSPALLTG